MNWTIVIDAQAEKQLRKFPAEDYKRIRRAINAMEVDPFFGDITKLSGIENNWRRRIGNYRILYEIVSQDKIIYVFHVERRSSHTY